MLTKLVLDYFATLVMTKNKMAARLKRLLAMTSRTALTEEMLAACLHMAVAHGSYAPRG